MKFVSISASNNVNQFLFSLILQWRNTSLAKRKSKEKAKRKISIIFIIILWKRLFIFMMSKSISFVLIAMKSYSTLELNVRCCGENDCFQYFTLMASNWLLVFKVVFFKFILFFSRFFEKIFSFVELSQNSNYNCNGANKIVQ